MALSIQLETMAPKRKQVHDPTTDLGDNHSNENSTPSQRSKILKALDEIGTVTPAGTASQERDGPDEGHADVKVGREEDRSSSAPTSSPDHVFSQVIG